MKKIILLLVLLIASPAFIHAADQYKINPYTSKLDNAGPVGLSGSNGNVGIGSTNPQCVLDVGGSVCSNGISLSGSSGWIDDGAVVRLTTSTDNVGIGTISTSAKLTTYSSMSPDGIDINIVSSLTGCDSFSKLLLHNDGTNGSTSFIDSECGGSAKTITANNSAQLSTVQKQFGTASGLFASATKDYISTPDSNDFALGTGDFTIGFWYMPTVVSSGSRKTVMTQVVDDANQWRIFFDFSGGAGAMTVDLQTPSVDIISTGQTFIVGTGYTFLWTRSGNSWRLFINGAQNNTTVTSSSTFPDIAAALTIGHDTFHNGTNNALDGYLDEIIIQKSFALHTSNYSIGSVPYGPTAGVPTLRLQSVGTTQWSIGSDGISNNELKFANGSDPTLNTRMTLTTAGNLGIGSTVPGQSLDVNGIIRSAGSSTATPAYVNTTGNNTTGIGFPAANNVTLSTNALERMRVNSSGNVGIGTLTPLRLLHIVSGNDGSVRIQGTDNTVNIGFDVTPNGALSSTNLRWVVGKISSANAFGVSSYDGSNQVEKWRIDNNGNVGIGTTTPAGALTVMNGNVGIGTWVPASPLQVKGLGSSSSTTALSVINSSGTADLSVFDNGGVAFNSFSPLGNTVTFSGSILNITAATRTNFTSGNVGINSANPGASLDIQGGIRTSSTTIGRATCTKSDGTQGSCSSVVDVTGSCTCS